MAWESLMESIKCQTRKKKNVFAAFIAFLCLVVSVAFLTVSFVLFCPDCPRASSISMWVTGVGSFLLLTTGLTVMGIVMIFREVRQQNISTDQDTVIRSEIPPEDLDKSPAPVLPYGHAPNHQPFIETSSMELPDYRTAVQYSDGDEASSTDLPDYFSTIQNLGEGYSSLDVGVWIRETPTTPPPCYQQAIEMSSSV